MARSRLLECSFLIPTRRDRNLSDGGPHGRIAWTWLEDELAQFGGATRSRALYEGWYIDRDTRKRVDDTSQRFFVAVPAGKVGSLRRLLRRACGVFRQKCIYLSVAGVVEFIGGWNREAG